MIYTLKLYDTALLRFSADENNYLVSIEQIRSSKTQYVRIGEIMMVMKDCL